MENEIQTVPEEVKEALKVVFKHFEDTGGARDMMLYVPRDDFTFQSALVSYFGVEEYELKSDAGAH